MSDEFTFDLVAQGDSGHFHTENLPGEDFRRIWARSPNESSPLSMKIKLAEVHHGSMIYEEKRSAATLLLFEIRFQSSLQKRRFVSASVTLEFFDQGGVARRHPHVVGCAPDRMHWLNKSTINRKTEYGASLGGKAGAEIAGVDASVNWKVEEEKPLKFHATVTGITDFSDGHNGDENKAVWTMEENDNEESGIPSFLQAAVLLRRVFDGPFKGVLRVHSEVDIKSVARRWLSATTDKDKTIDPVIFKPRERQVNNSRITGICDKDLKAMEQLELNTYFAVSLSEEDPLTPARPPAVQDAPENSSVAKLDPGQRVFIPAAAAPAHEAMGLATTPGRSGEEDGAAEPIPPEPQHNQVQVHEQAVGSAVDVLQQKLAELEEAARDAKVAARAAAEAADAAATAALKAADAATKAQTLATSVRLEAAATMASAR